MKAKDFIGTKQVLSGTIFGIKKHPETVFDVLDAKDCIMLTINPKTLKESRYNGIQLKLKNESMKKAQWTLKIPISKYKGVKNK